MGECNRLSRFDIEAGSIQGGEMTRSPLTDAAAIAEYEDDIAMATTFLTLAENQELECSRLRSENAELRAALREYLFAGIGNSTNFETQANARNMAREVLERTKK